MSEVASNTVIARVENGVGRITLNKPSANNALDQSMVLQIGQAVRAWAMDSAVVLILIDHLGEKAFCMGGDAVGLAKSAQGDGAWARRYFAEQYTMNGLLHDCPKPVVAIADGAVLGGGVGVALAPRYTVVTDRTSISFLEPTIGMVPDVGAAWILPRLPGETGLWLGLCGAKIRGRECVSRGLADYYVEQAGLADLKARLLAAPKDVERILERPVDTGLAERGGIDRLFAAESVVAIEAQLFADSGEFAQKQLDALRKASPLASVATFELLRRGGQTRSFSEASGLEYRANSRLTLAHDFRSWSKAALLERTVPPAWSPAIIHDVQPGVVEALFEPLEGFPIGG